MDWLKEIEAFIHMEPKLPKYKSLASGIQQLIELEYLHTGDRLPTVRKLAQLLSLSETTVSAAYKLLNEDQWIDSEVGRGTFVANRALATYNSSVSTHDQEHEKSVDTRHWRRRSLNTTVSHLRKAFPTALDCTSGRPDPNLLPIEIFKRSWHKAVEQITTADLQYGGPMVISALADQLIARLNVDDIPATSSEVIIGSSAHQLMIFSAEIAIAASNPRKPMIAVEEPGYYTILDTYQRLGYSLYGMGIDQYGVIPEALETALQAGVVAVLLTPRAHNPTGVSWSRARKNALADVLAKYPQVVIIEDDQFADLTTTNPGSLITDRRIEDQVIYIRSFSKVIAPDLRVVSAVARLPLRTQLLEAKNFHDGWTSRLAQQALANILADPEIDAAFQRARDVYQTRRNVITDILTERLNGVAITFRAADGVSVWIRLLHGVDPLDVINQAALKGVLITSGEPFFIRPGHNDVIRFNSGMIDLHDAERVANVIADAIMLALSAHSSGTNYSIP